MSEEFENEQTGESVEGVTIMIDGILKEFLEIIRLQNPQYKDNIGIIQSALMKGLEAIKDSK